MAPLRLGSVAPNFKAQTTKGDIDFHEFIDGSWAVLFSHPADFSKFLLIFFLFPSIYPSFFFILYLYTFFFFNIILFYNVNVVFSIIFYHDRTFSALYYMLDHQDITNVDTKGIPFTVRSVFVIDPKKIIRLMITYPASTGMFLGFDFFFKN